MQITREEAKLIIERTRGKFFGVTFRKRGDGSITKMIARNGVTKHLTPNVGISRMRAMRQQTKDAISSKSGQRIVRATGQSVWRVFSRFERQDKF